MSSGGSVTWVALLDRPRKGYAYRLQSLHLRMMVCHLYAGLAAGSDSGGGVARATAAQIAEDVQPPAELHGGVPGGCQGQGQDN